MLLMLGIIWPHMSPKQAILYHSLLPINHVYWGLAIDVAAMCMLATAVLASVDRYLPISDANKSGFWWAIVAAVLVWRLHVSLVWLELLSVKLFPTRLTFLICACGGIALWYWKRSSYIRVIGAFRLTLALLGCCIFWIIPQFLYKAIHPEPHEQSGFVRPVARSLSPHRRIVWIVFDELSQDQVFDHRQSNVDLSTFDQLRARSVLFTNIEPAGFYTELVIPSLLLGERVIGERGALDGKISIETAQGWTELTSSASIFADARREGWTTGVAGWYMPYCRVFAAQLNQCEWQSSSQLAGDYSPKKSILWNVFAPLRGFFLWIGNRSYYTNSAATMHASDYIQIMDWSHRLIADEDSQFIFLHLPVPHPWGFYNRQTRMLSRDGNYLDNLALADTALSEILQWIAATKSAPLTTLVLCSDHSWRVSYWSSIENWSPEEQRASRGIFDPRPVLMVHLPGQDQPGTITSRFAAVKEHDLVENLLKTTPSPKDLEAWAATQH